MFIFDMLKHTVTGEKITEKLVGLFSMPCLFHTVTGFYCPGCGGTRAVMALLRGDLAASFLYHPLVLYGAAAAGAELVTFLLAKITGNPRLYLGRETLLAYGAVGITLVNFVVKNLFLMWGVDLLSDFI